MEFVIGDKILFKKEKQSGIILEIMSSNKLLIKTSNNFEMIVSPKDIVLFDPATNQSSAYTMILNNKQKEDRKSISSKSKRNKSFLKIDLHIESLIADYDKMNNFEIVNIQLKKCEKEINNALNRNIEKIIIVHGIGTGTLRNEVHKLLNAYNLRYYLSTDGGSTEIIL